MSTSADQRVVGPGDLVDRWTEDGRPHFRFRVHHPYEPYWVLLSGRREVTRDRWGDVEIAVYHDPRHSWNVRRMIEAGGPDGEAEHEIPIDDRIDIGIFAGPRREDAPEAEPLYLAKHRISAADTTLEIVVDRKPETAGIDPFHALVDGDPDDNTARVVPASR